MPVLLIKKSGLTTGDPAVDALRYQSGDVVTVYDDARYDVTKASAAERESFWIVKTDGTATAADLMFVIEQVYDPIMPENPAVIRRRDRYLDLQALPNPIRRQFTQDRTEPIFVTLNTGALDMFVKRVT